MREDRRTTQSPISDQPHANREDAPVGFERHTFGKSRQAVAASDSSLKSGLSKVSSAFSKVGGAVGGAVSGAVGGAVRSVTSTRQSRASSTGRAASESPSGDYLGVGGPCRVCGRPVDESQSRCPHCGAFQQPLYTNPFFWIAVVVCLAIVVLLTIGVHSCSGSSGTSVGGDSATPSVTEEDKTELESAVSSAQAIIDENAASRSYMSVGIIELRAAVNAGQAVIDNASATADEVASAVTAIQSAMSDLSFLPVAFGSTYDWVWYDPLVAALDTYAASASQVAMQGIVVSMESVTLADGSEGTLVIVAISGDTTCPVAVTCSDLTEVSNGDIAVGADVSFAGTVTGASTYTADDGTASNIPAVTADFVTVNAAG